jgi:hypothetical protein
LGKPPRSFGSSGVRNSSIPITSCLPVICPGSMRSAEITAYKRTYRYRLDLDDFPFADDSLKNDLEADVLVSKMSVLRR